MFNVEELSRFSEVLKIANDKVILNAKSGGILKDLKEVQVGVQGGITAYPILTLYPLSETIKRVYSGGRFADVDRTIRFSVTSVTPTIQSSFGISNGLVNSLKQLFYSKQNRDFWGFKNKAGYEIVFNTRTSDIRVDDPLGSEIGIVIEASIDIVFSCQITLKSLSPVPYNKIGDKSSNLKEMTKIIHETYKHYSNSLLMDIKTFNYGILKPVKNYPSVTILSESATIEQSAVGLDLYKVNTYTYVHSTFSQGPESIYQNMDIIHKCRDILFANKYFLNRCSNYNMNSIEYGIQELEQDLVFVSSLNLVTESNELTK